MLVSGVRSSCEASARKRRSFSSVAARSANASSMRLSIVFRLRPSRPTSVRGSAGCTRRARSPAAMASAVTAIVSSGRRSRLISHQAAAASAASTTSETIASTVEQSGQRLARLVQRDGDDQHAGGAGDVLDEDTEAGATRCGLGREDPEAGAGGDRERRREHRRRQVRLAVVECACVDDVAGGVAQLAVGPRRQIGATRIAAGTARQATDAGAVRQRRRHGETGVLELCVDALQQESAQRDVRGDAGHEEAGGHAGQHGDEEAGAQAHDSAVSPSAGAGCSRRRGRCG